MSVLHRSIELLEPYDGKLSCTVLRGESARKGADLPDPCGQIIVGFIIESGSNDSWIST